MSVSVVSYNVLADGYIRAERYAGTPPALLDPAWRHPALAARVAGLGADVVCLQEVEQPVFARVGAALGQHERHHAPKPGRPDGVATLTRLPTLERRSMVYADDTARVALLVVVEYAGRRLGIANTHLKFDEVVGAAQAEALVDAIEAFTPSCDGWVVCGDFNAFPGSAVVAKVLARGLADSHAGRPDFTSNFSAGPKRIDFVFHSPSLRATPHAMGPISVDTRLPSRDEPSDHLPVVTTVAWA